MFNSITPGQNGPKTMYVTVQNFGQDAKEIKRIAQRISLKITAKPTCTEI